MTIAIIALFVVGALASLVVGVSNDAVNFLHSAIGSSVARKRVIYGVAAAGMMLGVLLSQNMMNLACHGVVMPELFTFRDLMAVFIAAMLVNIVLIDVCNSYAIPTSTTTALIISLAGAALAVAIVKSQTTQVQASTFIDTNHIFMIMAGIFISVILAFAMGVVTQFVSRLIFTFQSQRRSPVLLSLAGAVSVTVIAYFIIQKVLITDLFPWDSALNFIHRYLGETIGLVFALSFSFFLISGSLFFIDIPRVVVMFGTFALALSFAANDLVNFIGIPLTGIESALKWDASGLAADAYTPGALESHGLDWSNLWLLFFFMLSGVTLGITIFRSKKTEAVIDTELSLERQTMGDERFGSSELSRRVVRLFLHLFRSVQPNPHSGTARWIQKRYQPATGSVTASVVYFDTIRAAVNLVIASILILSGTWFRIPMSTTFIVFMVAMGTSLADRAWNRENAVYRVSGMFTILGVWFLVSVLILLLSGLLAILIWYMQAPAAVALTLLAGFALYRSYRYFKHRIHKKQIINSELKKETDFNLEWMSETGSELIRKQLLETSKIYFLTLQGFVEEDHHQLREASDKAGILVGQSKTGRQTLFANIIKLSDQMLEAGHHYIQAYDYLTELINSLHQLTLPLREHVENNHKGLSEPQKEEILHLLDETTTFINYLIHLEKERKFTSLDELVQRQQIIMPLIDEMRKSQLKRLKSGDSKTRVSVLYLEILSETKNILLYAINMVKSHRDFFSASRLY
ncbi:inorganic phosphate transporter [Breznakibacter xylanolyticus]|nr:inorganic phosphate transporter [Breznakibacter xylanolyticus]